MHKSFEYLGEHKAALFVVAVVIVFALYLLLGGWPKFLEFIGYAPQGSIKAPGESAYLFAEQKAEVLQTQPTPPEALSAEEKRALLDNL